MYEKEDMKRVHSCHEDTLYSLQFRESVIYYLLIDRSKILNYLAFNSL